MSDYSEALSRAASFCSRAEHCRKDVLSHVERHELSAEERSRLLAYLEKEGYLNEARFARAYASDRFRFHHWGRLKIRYGLMEKGVSSNLAEEALEVIPEEEYMQLLRHVVLEKYKRTQARNGLELAAKIMRHACAKGFEPALVRKCMAELPAVETEDV